MVFSWFKKKRPTQVPGNRPESTQLQEERASAVRTHESLEIPHDKIVARAYEIWIRKGQAPGKDFENWIEAEAELRAELLAQPDNEPLPRKSR